MFASLKTSELANSYSDLSGLYTGKDELRYTLVTFSMAMRHNLATGKPIFTGIRKLEEEIESTEDVRAMMEQNDAEDEELLTPHLHSRDRDSAVESENKIERDNAALAEILAKELAFLNRTIQMVSLVASRYLEEQEDAAWDYSGCCDCDIETGHDNVSSGDDTGTPGTPGTPGMLTRSQSHSYDDVRSADYNDPRPKNQLANTLLVGSGQLQQQFLSLCALAGTDIVLVNAMTTADRPMTQASFEKVSRALVLVLSSIYTEFSRFDADHRGHVVRVFQTLRDISSAAWAMMSLLAFSNLLRLTHGTDFETAPINPDDAIFSNQGRPFRPRMGYPAATMDSM